MKSYDCLVIGAGPGGYVAAIRAAKLGLSTAIVESRELGGTCLNRGCIPVKALIHASHVYHELKEAARYGVEADAVRYDWAKMCAYKEETTAKLVAGVEQLLKANGVGFFYGEGTVGKDRIVTVAGETGSETVTAKHVILATGSKPFRIPVDGIDLPRVLTSDELFRLDHVPESLVIIGGGVIGVEFATVYAALGTKVTIIEALPRLLPNMDKEISQNLKMILKKRGAESFVDARVRRIEQQGDKVICRYEAKGKEESVEADYILCAVGRVPETDGLFAEGAAPAMEKGRVLVDEHFESGVKGVYAIGDLIFGMMLAHTASAQGILVAEHIAGAAHTLHADVVPGCVYTDPEIASVGMTEEQAKEAGIPVKAGKFITSANGKSLITMEERGFVKIVVRAADDVVLGAQLMCARATDMIGEFVTAIANGMTSADLLKGMRAHPTYNEAIGEALEELHGGAVHVVPRKR